MRTKQNKPISFGSQSHAITVPPTRSEKASGRRMLVNNPFSIHAKKIGPHDSYNPLASLDPKSDSFTADCDSLVHTIMADTDKEPQWAESARKLWSGAIQFIRQSEKPEEQNFDTAGTPLGLNP
jgi:type IV secretory pathway TraG/TraD family ATPase VirD4